MNQQPDTPPVVTCETCKHYEATWTDHGLCRALTGRIDGPVTPAHGCVDYAANLQITYQPDTLTTHHNGERIATCQST